MPACAPCPSCGRTIPADAPAGQCPLCLLALGCKAPEGAASMPSSGRARDSHLFGDYVLERQVGAGGMGVVYEARHLALNRKVAVKVIRDAHAASAVQVRRFTLEAEAAARLDHPDIVPIHEVGEYEGQPFFSMDFVQGESLNVWIARAGFHRGEAGPGYDAHAARQRAGRAARLIARIARAVQHAHDRGVLHRDLKPGNILIDPDGAPHLTDFGLAKILHPDSGAPPGPALTASGDFAGTPSYMAPEQIGGGNITRATDIYGLGAVLYELLAGRPPFASSTPLETLRQAAAQPPARLRFYDPLLPADLEVICLKCLEKDPRHRYSTAQALAEDLENWMAGRPVKARPPGAARRTLRWTKRNPVGAAFIVTLALGLFAALVLLRIVVHQRNQIAFDRDQTFEEGMNRISLIWADDATREITITARELAILAGDAPSDLSAAPHQLCFGIRTASKPSSTAQRYARILRALQAAMETELGQPVAFRLKLFKRFNPDDETLARGEADLMSLSALHYLAAVDRAPDIQPVARGGKLREVVVFARAGAGINSLAGLAGKSMAFPDPGLSAAVWTKALLAGAGLRAGQLGACTNILDQGIEEGDSVVSMVETVRCVLRGEADAGVTTRHRFERNKHLGLVLIEQFTDSPRVLAARPGLGPRLVEAVRKAVQNTAESAWLEDPASDSTSGVLLASPSDFTSLRRALEKAALFDTSPTKK